MKKILTVSLVLSLLICLSGCSDDTNIPSNVSQQEQGSSELVKSEASLLTELAEPSNSPVQETTSQKNAARAAENYLSVMPFSFKGLVEQLEYEGYSHSDAVYGANRCGADWKEQAAKSAETYLNIMPFSRKELIEQLEYDGYTHEQAVYGAQANGY